MNESTYTITLYKYIFLIIKISKQDMPILKLLNDKESKERYERRQTGKESIYTIIVLYIYS